MCGIAGVLGRAGESGEAFLPRVQAMCAAMGHRGPDDEGRAAEGPLALGHRRLAILDVSPRGRQPFRGEDGSVLLAANGEIYNYRELRSDLERCGHRFQSDSDSEVILHAYEAYGSSFLERLRGMFALALYDRKLGELLLVRDRLGIKPLYYALCGERLIFASEIKALVASGLMERELDLGSLDAYLSLGYVPPPGTMIRGVSALLAGHRLVFRRGSLHVTPYWRLPAPRDERLEEGEILSGLRDLLRETVRLHCASDVPLGVFLSGGIDSSAVVGLMAESGASAIKTFSVGFAGGPERLNELAYARLVARRFETDHAEVMLDGSELAREMDRMIWALDQPSFDGINTYLVSKAAREGGLTVALSGLGGDELFGGYGTHKLIPAWGRWSGLWQRLPAGMKRGLEDFVGAACLQNKIRARKLRRLRSVKSTLDLYACIRMSLAEEEKEALYARDFLARLEADPGRRSLLDYFGECAAGETGEWRRVGVLELYNYMSWRLLRDTDAMSMAHSLEVRVPFVDHKVVEFVWSLPRGWERRWGYPKKLLVEAVSDLLPEEIASRPKQGFQFPVGEWMRGGLAPLVEDTLSRESVKRRGFFEPDGIEALYRDFLEGHYSYEIIWQFVVLELWLRAMVDPVPHDSVTSVMGKGCAV